MTLENCGAQHDLDGKVMIENCRWGKTWCPWNFFRHRGMSGLLPERGRQSSDDAAVGTEEPFKARMFDVQVMNAVWGIVSKPSHCGSQQEPFQAV